MYFIEFTQTAVKQLSKLEKQSRKRIVSTIERCRVRPYNHVKKLVDSPYFRLRVGDYRVIMDIRDSKLLIFVIEWGRRKEIYKK